MNLKINFLKIKKDKKFKKQNFNINVSSYWNTLLFITLLVIIFAFVFGSFTFREINKDFVLPSVKNGSQLDKVSKARINNILNYFSAKKLQSETILNSASPIVDPSK